MPALSAQHFLPTEGGDVDLVPGNVIGKNRTGCVGKGQAFAVIGNPFTVRYAHTTGGAVPGEKNIVIPVDLRQVGKLAIISAMYLGLKLQLLDCIGDPTFSEAFPCKRSHAARAKHRPHRHFKGTGIRSRYDTDAMGFRKVEHLAHQIDAILQARLADLGTM